MPCQLKIVKGTRQHNDTAFSQHTYKHKYNKSAIYRYIDHGVSQFHVGDCAMVVGTAPICLMPSYAPFTHGSSIYDHVI